MRVSLDINTLSQRLSKTIKAKGMSILKDKATELIASIHRVAKDWKVEIRAKMKKPASSRNGARHDNYTQNEAFPMRVSGDLQRSLHYRVTQRKTKDSIVISVYRSFREEGLRGVKGYASYGEYLNQEHQLLRGWKERTYELLDRRLREL